MTDEGAGPVEASRPDAGPNADPDPLPTFETPSARFVVGRGLQVAVAASRDLRRASLHIGLLVLLLVGPPVAAGVVAIDRIDPALLEALASVEGPGADLEGPLAALGDLYRRLSAAFVVAVFVLLAVMIDAQAVAISILGGRHVGRSLGFEEAIGRARQIFWRLLAATVLVNVLSMIVTLVADDPVRAIAGGGASGEIASSVLATLVVSPFIYASVAIVLGDARVFESLSRSIRLARTRVRITAVLVLYPAIVGAISVFAILATLDIVDRLGRAAGVDRVGPETILLVGTVIGSFAIGSLILTIDALVAGPQVVSYVGLTQGAPGLDLAPRPTGGARFPLIGRPMLVAIAIVWLVSLSAIGPG